MSGTEPRDAREAPAGDGRVEVVARAIFTSPYLWASHDEWDDPDWAFERGRCMQAAVEVLAALDAVDAEKSEREL